MPSIGRSSGCPPLVGPPPSHYNMKMHDSWWKMSTQITACKVCTHTTCVLTSLINILCFSFLHYIQEHYQSCKAFTDTPEQVVCPDCSAPLLNGNDVSISFVHYYILQHVLCVSTYVNRMGMCCSHFTAQGASV